jgi:tetratricopeptide (TPR) repeat protein
MRGILLAKSGDTTRADRDFAAAQALTKEPAAFNNLCWSKATAGVALISALAECDRALAARPDEAAFLDSKALVLLRLSRLDEAIATYDRALARDPMQATSLFGRAVAWARKGDATKSAADRAAAIKQSPDIEEQFAAHGLMVAQH